VNAAEERLQWPMIDRLSAHSLDVTWFVGFGFQQLIIVKKREFFLVADFAITYSTL